MDNVKTTIDNVEVELDALSKLIYSYPLAKRRIAGWAMERAIIAALTPEQMEMVKAYEENR